MDVIRVQAWGEYSWLRHGFSTRAGGYSTVYGKDARADVEQNESWGDLNLGFTKEDSAASVERNRAIFVNAIAQDIAQDQAGRLATVRQVHGVESVVVRDAGPRGDADGLMTQVSGVMLGIQVADCVPVLVADTRLRIVAALHAGWRGTAAGIVEQGIARMRAELGSHPEEIIAAIGPAIGACCYTVGEEVRASFTSQFAYADDLLTQRENGLHLDLAEANRRQLLESGVAFDRVTVIGECTACTRIGDRRKYFSHRAEKGFTGRAMGMIGIAGRTIATASAP